MPIGATPLAKFGEFAARVPVVNWSEAGRLGKFAAASLTTLNITLCLSIDDGANTYILSSIEGPGSCASNLTSFSLAPSGFPVRALPPVLQSLEAVRKVTAHILIATSKI